MSTLCSLLFVATVAWAAPAESEIEMHLHELLQDDDWRVRHDAGLELIAQTQPDLNLAIHQLQPITTRAGLPRFQSRLLSEPATAWAIAERLLHDEEDVEIRAALATVHATIPQADSGPLLHVVRHDASPVVRASAVASLARHNEKSGLKAIRIGLDDPHPRVRAAAISSAGYRKDGAKLQDGLLAALSDPDSQVRSQAARVIGWLEISAAYESLRELLLDASADVQLHALRAMRTLDAKQTQNLPELELLSKNPDERMQAILKTLQVP